MRRVAISELRAWATHKAPKPLILRGARQVGKSTLVRLLAEDRKLDLIEVNLERSRVKEFENREDFSIDRVLSEIEILSRKKFSDNTLLFLDEIQGQPAAINALRYFYEDKPGLKVIAAGSLLEVVARRSNAGMPVGRVEYYYLGPMFFSEFLMALGEDVLLESIREINLQSRYNNALHTRAVQLLKEYYLVGGMPEAVKDYAQQRSFESVRAIQNALVQTYKDDIPKYSSGKDSMNMLKVLDYSAHKLGEKVIFKHVSRDTHSTYVKKAVDLLALANVVYKTTHNRCNGLPLSVGEDTSIFKLYFVDIGIYNTYMGVEWKDLYQLSAEELLIRGKMAEQFIAQHLIYRDPKRELSTLYYWQRNGEGRSNAAEVDFVIAEGGVIYPIEVKSGSSGKLRSLWQFVLERKSKRVVRFDLSMRKQLIEKISHTVPSQAGNKQINCELLGLPLYAVENLKDILKS